MCILSRCPYSAYEQTICEYMQRVRVSICTHIHVYIYISLSCIHIHICLCLWRVSCRTPTSLMCTYIWFVDMCSVCVWVHRKKTHVCEYVRMYIHTHTCMFTTREFVNPLHPLCMYIYDLWVYAVCASERIYTHACMYIYNAHTHTYGYGVATITRLLKIRCLFCRI